MSALFTDPTHVENLRQSARLVGMFHPAIRSKRSGKIVSGAHRLKACPDWPVEDRDFKDEFEEKLAGIEDNTHRHVTEEEQRYRFKQLAEAAVKDRNIEPKKVCAFLSEQLKSRYSDRWIRNLLPEEYKALTVAEKAEVTSASQELSSIGEEAKATAEQVTTALTSLQQTAPLTEATPVMPGCLCPQCPNKTQCGIL